MTPLDDTTVHTWPGGTRVRPIADHCLAALPEGLHPVVRRVLAARGVTPAELAPALSRLIPVRELPGVVAASRRLTRARVAGERVVVVGDFDTDGATATALTISCLRAFGFSDPRFIVPDRFTCGYGLSPAVADLAAALEPALLVTVDNGITSLDGVRRARELGMDVLITDHHLPGTMVPEQALLVGPSVPGARFGSAALCGVGVAFYLMAVLGRELEEAGVVPGRVAREAVTACLDLVALGTVADMVPLDYNNRVLVREGLRRIQAGRTRPGIRALFEVARREPLRACAADLGYGIAPRLNAAGRLDDMTLGVECLLAGDDQSARKLARRLDGLNLERRELQARMQGEAEALLMGTTVPAEAVLPGVCLFDERWHPGVVGLVANRIRECTGRPAIAFARAAEPGLLRGSARSVEGLHVRDAIAAAAASLPAAVIRFGGHAMAAGITLAEQDLSAFTAAFAAEIGRTAPLPDAGTLVTDGELAVEHLGLEVARLLADTGPWGQGFPEPVFVNRFLLLGQRVIAERHLRLTVRHPDSGDTIEAISFNQPLLRAGVGASLRIAYRLDVNTFRQPHTPQLIVERLEAVAVA